MQPFVKGIFKGFCENALSDELALLKSNLAVANTSAENYKHMFELVESPQKQLVEQIAALSDKVGETNKELAKSAEEYAALYKKFIYALPYPKATQDLINYYYAKYPAANIDYSGRPDEGPQDVRTFCLPGQNDYRLKRRVEDAQAVVASIMLEDKLEFHRACDEAVARVVSSTRCNYVTDYNQYQAEELWQYAPATEYLQKGDCDDWALLRYVKFRIAGVPPGLLRITVGNCRRGEGHATTHYLASDGKWHHPNSTSNYELNKYPDATEYPLNDDKADVMGIEGVWFSFNEEKSWHTFTTSDAKQSFYDNFNQQRLLKRIRIGGVVR